MTTGYIYVIKNEVGGLGGFKIGQTINPPRRFRELKLGTKSSLVGLWRSDKYASIERFLHKTFKHLRVPQSEWFALTPDVLQDVIGRLNRCSTCIELKSEYKTAEPVYIPPTYVEPVYSPPIYSTSSSTRSAALDRVPAWTGAFCGIPVFGWFMALMGLCDRKNQHFEPGYKTVSVISVIISFLLIASAEAKPLHTYEQQSRINVSSLIK